MTKTWVALDKQLATTFSKIRREYSEIEAMFSLSLDVNCGKQRSHRAYSRMWTWSVTRVIRFVKKVKEGETLTKQQRNTNETPYSLITLGIEDATKQQRNSNETLTKHEYKEQEVKKAKTPKKKYGEFLNVLLSEEQFKSLNDRFNGTLAAKIENLSGYVASTGKKYKSHYHTILNWARKEQVVINAPNPSPSGTCLNCINLRNCPGKTTKSQACERYEGGVAL